MKNRELENWQAIKESMEESGNTENFYYTRAVAILAGFPDPLNIKEDKDEKLE